MNHSSRCSRAPALASSLFLLLASGCASASDPDGTDRHWVQVGGERYTVEIADDDAERARGLMFREHMDEDAGMLFIHEREAPRSYWMMNTRIPLDILYFDEDLRLVSQRRDTPPCPPDTQCPAYPSDAPARYVLELNAGEAARLGLEAGALLHLDPDLAAGRR